MNIIMKVYFTLTGRFDPESVTLGYLRPTKMWRYGEQIHKSLLTYKHDGWQISLPQVEAIDIDTTISTILYIIYPLQSSIKELCRIYKLDSEIAVAIYLNGDNKPILHLSQNTIKQIYEMNVEVDIDIY